ncbi:MAG: hypothetical protein IKX31_02670 [Muribaculaceae bacterium]|nr:hypothetical protein [Muribaculaceae bacterium]
MKKIITLMAMMFALSPMIPQTSMLAANGSATGDKDLTGLNYYDFYVDYFNSTFEHYQIYNGDGFVDLGWSIQGMQDMNHYFNVPTYYAKNCFYDWCLKYVDENNDSILSVDELAAVRVIDSNADPEHILGRNAVDYHFDWFPNLETLELNHPNWHYLVGDRNEALYLQRFEIPYENYFYTTNVYFNDINPFSHLYLPMTGNLNRVEIKNSKMLFFNYEPQDGVDVPEISIEGAAMGDENGYTFSLNKYVAAGLDVNRILSVDNAQVVTGQDGSAYLQFNNGAREAHMQYLIAADGDKQYTCNSTIKIQAQTEWVRREKQVIHEGESVAIDQEHFPDVNFRQYLATHVDINEDGILTYEELGNLQLLRTYHDSWHLWNYYDSDDFEGEDMLKNVINFKGIEYLYNLEGVSFGHRTWGIDVDTNIFHFRNLDLSKNPNLIYFYMGTDAEAIDIKLPEIDGLEFSNPLMRMGFKYVTNEPAVRLVELDDDHAYSLEEDIENGLDLNRLTVLEGGHLDGNKVVFDEGETCVDLQYVARPPIMGGAHYPFDRYLQNYYLLYNLINTKLYDSSVFDTQMIMHQLTDINNVDINKEVKNIRYYNIMGVESAEPFHGINIKVTTYTDGTRKSEKLLK